MDIFEDLLQNAYSKLNKTASVKSLNFPEIELEIIPNRVLWKNINQLLEIINRSLEHFTIHIKDVLRNNKINWYSENPNDGILIHGKFIKKALLTLLFKKYIHKYVICPSCNLLNTELNKINNKKYNFICLECNNESTICM